MTIKVGICPICGAKNVIKEDGEREICIHFKHLSYAENEETGELETDEIMFSPIVPFIRVKLIKENVNGNGI